MHLVGGTHKVIRLIRFQCRYQALKLTYVFVFVFKKNCSLLSYGIYIRPLLDIKEN